MTRIASRSRWLMNQAVFSAHELAMMKLDEQRREREKRKLPLEVVHRIRF
jgi:hypothetical protein